jgi:tripartite-type tricarboxylate transporter receptor subunit TctC
MSCAVAQPYPTKPIRIIAGTPPGGAVDTMARFMGQKLAESWGQPVITENRAGASGAIGAEVVAKSAADGYTLLLVSSQFALTPLLAAAVRYDPVKDFAPVILVAQSSNVLVIHPSIPARSVRELIALARAKPGVLSYGSGGIGTSNHLAAELFKGLARVDILHVPYKGAAPALSDVIGGQVHMIFPNLLSGLPHARSGRLRALAVTGAKRALGAPELPTVAEAGLPGYETSTWLGVVAPLKTPGDIVGRLNAEISRLFSEPSMKDRLVSEGAEFAGGTPAQFGNLIKTEIDKWARIFKSIGVTPEAGG